MCEGMSTNKTTQIPLRTSQNQVNLHPLPLKKIQSNFSYDQHQKPTKKRHTQYYKENSHPKINLKSIFDQQTTHNKKKVMWIHGRQHKKANRKLYQIRTEQKKYPKNQHKKATKIILNCCFFVRFSKICCPLLFGMCMSKDK